MVKPIAGTKAMSDNISNVQAFLDLERVVQVGVVDKPLPAHRGARFLEVHPHDDEEVFP